MINSTSQFFAILTNVGVAKQANADALGVPWRIAQMGVGDANDTDPLPSAAQTRLINERRRAPLNQLRVDPANNAIIIAEQVIPAEVGGFWIREIALYDADGDMVAVANCAPSFKPLLTQGSGRTQVVRVNLLVSNSSNVELKIDPSVVLATRAYVDQKVLDELNKLDFKFSVVAATTGPIALNGLQSVDGEPGVAGLRVLVWKQALAKDNGIYLMAANGWTRAADADSNLEVTPGLFVHVEKGALYGDSVFQLVTDAPIVLGATDLVFESPIGRTGIGAGTYRSVTVDKYGRVVGGTNPTTLAAYGVDFASQAEAEAQADQDSAKPMSALRVYQAIVKYLNQATETAFGWAKVATQTQTNTGVDDTTVVTPKKFSAGIAALVIQATEAIKGIAKVATQAQTNSGADDTTIVTPKKFSAGLAALIVQATEAITGIAKVATLAQTSAGTDDTVMVTPRKLRWGFSASLAAAGQISFPTWLGGLVLQWYPIGNTANQGPTNGFYYGEVVTTFPMAFPTACWVVLATPFDTAGVEGGTAAKNMSRTGVNIITQTTSAGSAFAYVFAIGN